MNWFGSKRVFMIRRCFLPERSVLSIQEEIQHIIEQENELRRKAPIRPQIEPPANTVAQIQEEPKVEKDDEVYEEIDIRSKSDSEDQYELVEIE